jgi:hypothetical protein
MKKLLTLVSIIVTLGLVSSIAFAKPYKEPLDSITFIHYKNGAVKIVGTESKAQLCYKLMGVKWNSFPITYYINPSVDANAIAAGNNEWDSHTSKVLFGSYSKDNSANFDSSPDGRNEYSLGNYPQSGVIAVTRTWYTRGTKAIVEYDVMFDSDFIWGDATKDSSVMDWQNIATHETGHGLGLSDLYTNACSSQTMYGYSSEGDTAKRTLESGDIAGLQKLYGA